MKALWALGPAPWTLSALLAAALLTGCNSDRLLTDPERTPASTDQLKSRSELQARSSAATTHTFDGYVWANSPTSPSYTPSTFYSFNRSGGTIVITKTPATTGQYSVRFNGLSPLLGAKSTVKVTGYFPDNAYCKPASPKLVSNVVKIKCFNGTTGVAQNAYYTVVVTRNYVENAFAQANLPTGNNYAPPGGTSWNPAGAMRVFRFGVGQYQVRFSGLGSRLSTNGGHVQVVTIGTGAQHCQVGSWGGSPDLLINVTCRTRTGALKDIKFNVLFLMPASHLGYAWANQPSTASYTPSTFYSYNSSGGAIGITHSSTGKYTITFSGLGTDLLDGGDVQVTAYGGGTAQCKVESWGTESVNVRCFAPGGALVDSYYDIFLGT